MYENSYTARCNELKADLRSVIADSGETDTDVINAVLRDILANPCQESEGEIDELKSAILLAIEDFDDEATAIALGDLIGGDDSDIDQ